tara:strand:+ start:328 stop:783 length:456 start_codon:yes stop_codon:yes gene_type:complete
MSDYTKTEEIFYPKKNDFFSPGNLKKYSDFADEVLGPFTGERKAGDAMSEYYRDLAKRPFGGGKSSGRSETLADGSLTALYPDSFEPIIFPGGGGGAAGGKSTGQRIAGAATGALSGAASGAALGAKLGSAVPGIGTAIGAGVGLLGGLFG